MEIETTRTQLRRLQTTDFNRMRLLESDPAVMRFTPSRIPQSEEQTRDRIKSQIEKQKGLEPFGIWVAEEKGPGTFIGWFMLVPSKENELELGFMLHQAKWGQGFATEISRALIEFAKGKGVFRIIAMTNVDNDVSMRVLEKLGLQYKKEISVPERVFGGEIELKFYEMEIG